MTMGEVLIELEHVGVAFASQRNLGGSRYWALEDVNLTLRRGEVLGVIGRNGAGKSTLLRVIAGILQPDRGRIRRGPVSCQLMSLALGFVAHLSGRDNAILSGLLLGTALGVGLAAFEAVHAPERERGKPQRRQRGGREQPGHAAARRPWPCGRRRLRSRVLRRHRRGRIAVEVLAHDGHASGTGWMRQQQ